MLTFYFFCSYPKPDTTLNTFDTILSDVVHVGEDVITFDAVVLQDTCSVLLYQAERDVNRRYYEFTKAVGVTDSQEYQNQLLRTFEDINRHLEFIGYQVKTNSLQGQGMATLRTREAQFWHDMEKTHGERTSTFITDKVVNDAGDVEKARGLLAAWARAVENQIGTNKACGYAKAVYSNVHVLLSHVKTMNENVYWMAQESLTDNINFVYCSNWYWAYSAGTTTYDPTSVDSSAEQNVQDAQNMCHCILEEGKTAYDCKALPQKPNSRRLAIAERKTAFPVHPLLPQRNETLFERMERMEERINAKIEDVCVSKPKTKGNKKKPKADKSGSNLFTNEEEEDENENRELMIDGYEALEAKLDDMYVSVADIKGKIDTDVADMKGKINMLEGRMEKVESKMNKMEGKMDTIIEMMTQLLEQEKSVKE